MKIKLVGNDETYAVRDIVRLFVPMQKYEFVKGSDYDVLASFENGGYFAEYKTENGTFCHNINKSEYDKNMLKLCLFKAMQKAFSQKPPWGILTGIRPTKTVREMMEIS